MALVRYGAGIVQMSGSIAGTTFARNKSGNYARARTTPVNPASALQETRRATLAQLADRWSQVVTAVQRTAWNLYGSNVAMKNRLGEVIHLSGYNHYLRSNTAVLLAGDPAIDAGPTVFELPDQDPLFSFTASEAGASITYVFDDAAAWVDEDGGFLLKFQGKPQNAQRNFFAGPWRFHGIIEGAISPPTTPDEETSPPFVVTEGNAQWCYGRILRADGRLSEPFVAGPTLVGA